MLTHKFRFLSNVSLKVRLMLIFLGFILALGIIQGIYLNIDSSKLLIENERQKDQNELSQIGSNMAKEFNEIDIITKNLIFRSSVQNILKTDATSHNPYLDVSNQKTMLDAIDNVIVSYSFRFQSIYIYNTEGKVYGGSGTGNDANIPLKKDFLQRILTANGKLVIGPSINDQLFMMGRVINSPESFSPVGILLAVVKTSPFQFYKNAADNKYLLYNQDSKLMNPTEKGIPRYRTMLFNNSKFIKIQGKSYLVSVNHFSSMDWTLVKLTLKSSLLKSVSALKRTTIISVLIVICFFIPLSMFISSKISKPIKVLSQLMLETITRDFNNKSKFDSNDEIGRLSQAYNIMIDEINDLIQNKYVLEIVNKDSELKMLQSQINPHFLYNTLDTINWAARLNGIDEVGELAESLAKLMRIAIQDDGNHYTVQDELEYINRYMTIQKYRYEERIEMVLDIDPDVMTCRIPKLILQPLLENAIVHNVEINPQPITIFLSIYKENDHSVLVKIEDNGAGIPKERMTELEQGLKNGKLSNSYGLINIHRRLLLNYGWESGLIINPLEKGTSVQFQFPIQLSRSEKNVQTINL